MGKRIDLHNILKGILGSNNAYFQPPESYRMNYPCIVYSLSSIDTKFADNTSYSNKRKYTLIVIDKNPDSDIPDKVSKLPLCRAGSFYITDNLNHYPFTIFY